MKVARKKKRTVVFSRLQQKDKLFLPAYRSLLAPAFHTTQSFILMLKGGVEGGPSRENMDARWVNVYLVECFPYRALKQLPRPAPHPQPTPSLRTNDVLFHVMKNYTTWQGDECVCAVWCDCASNLNKFIYMFLCTPFSSAPFPFPTHNLQEVLVTWPRGRQEIAQRPTYPACMRMCGCVCMFLRKWVSSGSLSWVAVFLPSCTLFFRSFEC